jgi:hypothetical protein
VTVRLAVSVEGPTEYEFCREVLGPHLTAFAVHVEPKIVVTKRNLCGPNATGGAIGIERFRNEVRRLLPSFDFVTTLYDFYGFKGREPGETPDALCRRMSLSLDQPRHLIAYVQVYEFEALLFSAPSTLARYLDNPLFGAAMETVAVACGGAEQVNDGPQTAPSRRLIKLFHDHLNQRYDKTFHGPLLAMEIGLSAIRSACPRFNAWLTRLERLGIGDTDS